MKTVPYAGLKKLWLPIFVMLFLAGCSLLNPFSASTATPDESQPQEEIQATPTFESSTGSPVSEPSTEETPSATADSETTVTPTSTPVATNTPTATASVTTTPTPEPNYVYALVNVPDKGVLSVRGGPGTNYRRVGGLAPNQIGIELTGHIAGEKPHNWYEIQRSETATGWITSYYVIEYVEPDTFCKDERPKTVIGDLAKSIEGGDGRLLSTLVSPMHGVTIRLWRDETDINILYYAPNLYDSDYPINWGNAPGTTKDVFGIFDKTVYPYLDNVFGSTYEVYCNDDSKVTNIDQPWLPQYENINYYTVYRPETKAGEGDWQAWLVGFDYVNGKPYLFALIHFQGMSVQP
jgi:uncharacterized protein YraI